MALLDLGVEHFFTAGDSVLLMQRRIGKHLPKALGPYRFLKYKGEMKLTAEL